MTVNWERDVVLKSTVISILTFLTLYLSQGRMPSGSGRIPHLTVTSNRIFKTQVVV